VTVVVLVGSAGDPRAVEEVLVDYLHYLEFAVVAPKLGEREYNSDNYGTCRS